MAYSGATLGAPLTAGSASASTFKQVKLDRESELRIEVGNDSPLRLRLLNGTAEIFGSELPPEIWQTFPPRLKFAVSFFHHLILFFLYNLVEPNLNSNVMTCQVFTWYGATIEMDGSTELDYTADEVCASASFFLFFFVIIILFRLSQQILLFFLK